MDKETLLSQFKERVGESNLSDRTFSEITDQFAHLFEDDSKITEETWKLPLAVFNSMAGQLRHDLSNGINTFKADYQKTADADYTKKLEDAKKAWEEEWKKNHPDQQQQQSQQSQQGDLATQIAEAVKAQMASITGADSDLAKSLKTMNDFMAQQAQAKKEADVAKMRQALKDYLINDRKANREPAVNLAISKLEIGADANLDQLKMQAEKGYEAVYKEFFGDGGKPFGGSSAGGGEHGGDADLKKYIEAQKARLDAQAKQAEDVRKSFV